MTRKKNEQKKTADRYKTAPAAAVKKDEGLQAKKLGARNLESGTRYVMQAKMKDCMVPWKI